MEVPCHKKTKRDNRMRMEYFGDSYNIVKRSLINCLGSFGKWGVLPMFTENVSEIDAKSFSTFLQVRLISRKMIDSDTDRFAYFNSISGNENVLLDPNIGLKFNSFRKISKPDYIYLDELKTIVNRQQSFLTMVFDQSLARRKEHTQLTTKLEILRSNGIEGFAYVSHASFLFLSADKNILESAYLEIMRQLNLPISRLLKL